VDAAESRFTDLYGAHYRKVLGYLLRRIDCASTAQDLTEEVFLVAWRKLDAVPPGPEAEYWLYAVARKTLAAHVRKSANRSRIAQRLLGRDRPVAVLPDEVVVRSEEARVVLHGLERLGNRDRELIRLAYWEELPHKAIAELLGISRGNVDVRLHRAIRRLAKELNRSGHSQIGTLPIGTPKEPKC
jgi:RNA polymerase sigma-70 factor (ECF subfamily)